MPKRKQGEQKLGTCVYCGFEGSITGEHVFPGSIFIDKTLDQMLTVPVCNPCNQMKSLADKDLGVALMLDIFATQHPDTQALREHILTRMNLRTKRWLARAMSQGRERLMATDSGVIVGGGFEIDFNYSRIVEAHQSVIRGLHYHDTGEMLLPPYPVEVALVPWNMAPGIIQAFQRMTSLQPKVKGNLTAWWQSFRLTEYAEPSRVWLICYYNGILFLGATGQATPVIQKWRGMGEASERRAELLRIVAPEASERPLIVPRDDHGRPYIPPR